MTISTIITIIFVLFYYVCALWLVRDIKITTKDICITSMIIAMTIVLESIQIPLPTGATISLLSPVPLLLLALLWDYKMAIVAGWICAVLALFMVPGWQLIHWAQFFVEHLVCFSCLGFAGIFGVCSRHKIVGGIFLASTLKIIGHILSGVLFFSQNAWDGWGALGYSLTYNLSQNIPLCILSGIVVMFMPLQSIQRVIKGSL